MKNDPPMNITTLVASTVGTAAANAAGMPAAIPPSPPGEPLPTVGSLLDACTLAGFTENLYVAHHATDGWSRQSQYDSSAARAFVLAPGPISVSYTHLTLPTNREV